VQHALSAEQAREQVLLLDVKLDGGREIIRLGRGLLAAGRRAGIDLGELAGDARRGRRLKCSKDKEKAGRRLRTTRLGLLCSKGC
jgi:hypothetical protein